MTVMRRSQSQIDYNYSISVNDGIAHIQTLLGAFSLLVHHIVRLPFALILF